MSISSGEKLHKRAYLVKLLTNLYVKIHKAINFVQIAYICLFFKLNLRISDEKTRYF